MQVFRGKPYFLGGRRNRMPLVRLLAFCLDFLSWCKRTVAGLEFSEALSRLLIQRDFTGIAGFHTKGVNNDPTRSALRSHPKQYAKFNNLEERAANG
jgi:hypothetical protein